MTRACCTQNSDGKGLHSNVRMKMLKQRLSISGEAVACVIFCIETSSAPSSENKTNEEPLSMPGLGIGRGSFLCPHFFNFVKSLRDRSDFLKSVAISQRICYNEYGEVVA